MKKQLIALLTAISLFLPSAATPVWAENETENNTIERLNGEYIANSEESVLTSVPIGSFSGNFTIEHTVTINSMPANGSADKSSTAGFFLRFMNTGANHTGGGWYLTASGSQAQVAWKNTQMTNIGKIDIGKTYTFKYEFTNVGSGTGAALKLSIIDSNGNTVASQSGLNVRNFSDIDAGKTAPITDIEVYNQANVGSTANVTLADAAIHYITASGECGDNLTWTRDDSGTLTIDGNGDMETWLPAPYPPWIFGMGGESFITTVVIGSGVTSIVGTAFSNCNNLTSVTIPNSVTQINDLAFIGCDALTDVYYGGTEDEWNAITIGSDNECLTDATIHYVTEDTVTNDIGTETVSYTYSYGNADTYTREMEKLDRGLVAVKTDAGVYLSWRLLDSEDAVFGSTAREVSFNIYRDGVKIDTEADSTNYVDTTVGSSYAVAPVVKGVEGEKCEAVAPVNNNYFDIPLQKPADETIQYVYPYTDDSGNTLTEATYSFFPADCSTGDLDGDGEYEIIIKWTSSERDVGSPGDPAYSGTVRFAAYKLDGTKLWDNDINLGKNVYSSAHTVQFLVYDFDGDGKSEMMCQTSLGSKDGKGSYVSHAANPRTNSTIYNFTDEENENADYRGYGRITTGEEFLTVFNGETGEAIDTIDLPTSRGSENGIDYGDDYGNRSNRFVANVAYLDGEKPYAVYFRGYYFGRDNYGQRTSIAGISFDGERLSPDYRFDTKEGEPGYYDGAEQYVGQGNHNCTVADVDNDGKDEFITGALCMEVDDNNEFRPKWCTFRGHGDALHIGDYDPTHEGFEFFTVHEDNGENTLSGETVTMDYGMSVIDAATGEIMFHQGASSDTGRGVMANIGSGGYYQVYGSGTGTYQSNGGTDFTESAGSPGSNFRIFWDGDLYDEVLDGTTVTSWNGSGMSTIFNTANYDCVKINGTKSNPALQADLFGDWREELVYPTSDGSKLRVFTTTEVTDYKIKTLMQDPVYRSGVAAEQTAYNQPPHVGFYMGLAGTTVHQLVASGECGDNLTWELYDNGTLYIDGTGDMWDWSSSSSAPWYIYNSQINTVIMGGGVTSIGDYAFYNCDGLTSVTIPDSVTSIGHCAFENCSGLTSITIPDSVTSIGNWAFYGCSGLTSVTIPDSVTTIGVCAFENCSGLTSVTIPDSVTSIGQQVFDDCSGLTSVTIPDSVTSIGDYAFEFCYGLTSVTIPSSVTSIGNDAFRKCSALTDVYYGGTEEEWNAITIGSNNECLTDATIHYASAAPTPTPGYNTVSLVKLLGDNAATSAKEYQEAGKSVYITISITDADGNDAVYGTDYAAEYPEGTILKEEKYFNLINGYGDAQMDDVINNLKLIIYNDVPKTISAQLNVEDGGTIEPITTPTSAPMATPALTPTPTTVPHSGTDGSISWSVSANGTLTISGTGAIPDYSAGGAPWYAIKGEISKIVIEQGIDTVGTNAFYDLSRVSEAALPSTVTQVNAGAFEGCTALGSIALPEGMNRGIGAGAFKNTGLTTVTVPSGVTAIESGAFEGCISITEITLPFIGSQVGSKNNTDTFSYIFGGAVPASLKKVTITSETNVPENAFKDLGSVEGITINDDIKAIGNGAFDGCSSLKAFAIPSGIAEISDNTFRGCESAVTITVPDTVQAIGEAAFDGCKKLKSVNIPSGVTVISDNTFRNCESLTKIEIPVTVTNIGVSVLEGCKKLNSIKVPFVGVNANPGSTAVTDEGQFGYFFGCENGKIPAAVTKIEITGTDRSNYIPKEAFKDCAYIEDIIIDGGGSVLSGAFENCKNLKHLYIPRSISTIGETILKDCTRLETLIVPFIGFNRQDQNTETSVLGGFFGYDDSDITGTIQYYNEKGDYHFYKIPRTLKNVSILNQTTIPAGAFSECDFIEKVAVITGASMNDKAFYHCASLKSVTLPNDLQTIGAMTFAECESLETINIPTKVKTIGEQSFYNCRALKNVTIPDSVTEIADDVFNGTNLFSEVNLLANTGVVTCSEGSTAYNYAIEKGIQTNVVPSEQLDVKKTATTVALLSDNSYLFDITDSYNMRGILHAELYAEGDKLIAERTRTAEDVEYRIEFTAEEMTNVSYAKIYIIDEDGTAVTTENEIILYSDGSIPELNESDAVIEYNDGTVTFTGTSLKADSVLLQAIYNDDNTLNRVNSYPVSDIEDKIEVDTDFTAEKAKFMLWSSLAGMKPAAAAVVK